MEPVQAPYVNRIHFGSCAGVGEGMNAAGRAKIVLGFLGSELVNRQGILARQQLKVLR